MFILTLIARIKTYSKMGLPGWAAFIPIYNKIVLYKLFFGKGWKFIYEYIPIYGIYMKVLVGLKIAKSFGEDTGFGWGLAMLGTIFWMIIGFKNNRFYGPSDASLENWLKRLIRENSGNGSAGSCGGSQSSNGSANTNNTGSTNRTSYNETDSACNNSQSNSASFAREYINPNTCEICGYVNEPGSVFCSGCGRRLN